MREKIVNQNEDLENRENDIQNGKKAKKSKTLKRIKGILIGFVVAFIFYHIVIMPIATVVIYESIFSGVSNENSWENLTVEDFEGLEMERSDFTSGSNILAGYKYSKKGQAVRGVVVIAHGFGCGGQKLYMAFADYFTSNGYLVFAYDATGNDKSGGDTSEGLPQGVIDLNNALVHVKEVKDYRGLPIMLFGHSWGGYSVANVLGMHQDVKAAAIVAGFNESENMLEHMSLRYAGIFTYFGMPYVEAYENLKFGGEYTGISAVEEMGKTDAGIIILHSKDDETVPTKYGYDKFYEKYSDDERFEFLLFEDRGHNFLYYTKDAQKYREQLEKDYKTYLEISGKKDSAEIKAEYMTANIDKEKYFDVDEEVMGKILATFNEYCKK